VPAACSTRFTVTSLTGKLAPVQTEYRFTEV
jgi:hypothetical protein